MLGRLAFRRTHLLRRHAALGLKLNPIASLPRACTSLFSTQNDPELNNHFDSPIPHRVPTPVPSWVETFNVFLRAYKVNAAVGFFISRISLMAVYVGLFSLTGMEFTTLGIAGAINGATKKLRWPLIGIVVPVFSKLFPSLSQIEAVYLLMDTEQRSNMDDILKKSKEQGVSEEELKQMEEMTAKVSTFMDWMAKLEKPVNKYGMNFIVSKSFLGLTQVGCVYAALEYGMDATAIMSSITQYLPSFLSVDTLESAGSMLGIITAAQVMNTLSLPIHLVLTPLITIKITPALRRIMNQGNDDSENNKKKDDNDDDGKPPPKE